MEILDYSAIPRLVREPIYTSLGLTQHLAGLKTILRTKVFSEIVRLKTTRVIELGSGSGKNLKILAKTSTGLRYQAHNLSFLLTDKFPSLDLWKANIEKYENLSAEEQPLSFESILTLKSGPEDSKQQITFLIISASHHMSDKVLRKFLKDSAKLRANVIIVEPLERKASHAVFSVMGSSVGVLTPFMRHLSVRDRFNQTLIYYSGLGLFIQSYDGVLSTLRQRTVNEFEKLVGTLPYQLTQGNKLGRFSSYSVTTFQFKA